MIHGPLDADAKDEGFPSHAAMQAHRRAVRSGDAQRWHEGLDCPDCGCSELPHDEDDIPTCAACGWNLEYEE